MSCRFYRYLFIVTPIVGVCNCSMFCCTLLYVHSSIAIILMGKRELIALLNLSSWCLVMVERLFLAVPRGCLQFVIVVFSDHTHLLFLTLARGAMCWSVVWDCGISWSYTLTCCCFSNYTVAIRMTLVHLIRIHWYQFFCREGCTVSHVIRRTTIRAIVFFKSMISYEA